MKIGIACPVLIDTLKGYFEKIPEKCPMGMGGGGSNTLIEGLIESGHRVSIYTLDPSIIEPIRLEGERITLFMGKYRTPARNRMKDFFYAESEQIRSFIVQDEPQIVQAHWSYEFAAGAIKSKIPHLITLHDAPLKILCIQHDLYRLIRFFMHIWVMNNGSAFSAVSPYLIRQPFIRGKVTKITPNPIHRRFISKSHKKLDPKSVKLVSCLAGWGPIKNSKNALMAFRILRKRFGERISYTIYGHDFGPDEIAYKWAKKYNLLSGVNFKGYLLHNELMRQLGGYDIMLHPSREESFGLTLIEAMAFGLPVVAGRHSGAVPWVLQQGKCGELVDVNSPEEIANCLQGLIEDSEQYEQLSKNCLLNINERFSHEKIVQQYIQIYQEILI